MTEASGEFVEVTDLFDFNTIRAIKDASGRDVIVRRCLIDVGLLKDAVRSDVKLCVSALIAKDWIGVHVRIHKDSLPQQCRYLLEFDPREPEQHSLSSGGVVTEAECDSAMLGGDILKNLVLFCLDKIVLVLSEHYGYELLDDIFASDFGDDF